MNPPFQLETCSWQSGEGSGCGRTVVVGELCGRWNVLLGKQADAIAEAARARCCTAGCILRLLSEDCHNHAVWAAGVVHKSGNIACRGTHPCHKLGRLTADLRVTYAWTDHMVLRPEESKTTRFSQQDRYFKGPLIQRQALMERSNKAVGPYATP